MSENRDRGVEFGDLTDDLEAESYPMSKSELLDRYGDRELEQQSGTTTVREVLAETGDDEFQSADEVHESILNMIGDDAIGRKGYTDRGTTDRGNEEADSA